MDKVAPGRIGQLPPIRALQTREGRLSYMLSGCGAPAVILFSGNDDPTLREQRDLLETIPGVGDKTINTLLSHYGGELRFDKTGQAVAFAGLDTRQHESGSSEHGKPTRNWSWAR